MIENLRIWIVQFYCLKIEDAMFLLLECAALFCLLDMMLKPKVWWKLLIGCALIASMTAIIYITLGNRGGGGDYHINLIPFHTYREVRNGGHPELYRSNFMNAALFYPAGLLAVTLMPKKWPAWCRCLLVVLLLGTMSAGIEFLQYRFALGQVEIDDVIHNTLGALTGSVVGLLVPYLLGAIKEKLAKHLPAAVKK